MIDELGGKSKGGMASGEVSGVRCQVLGVGRSASRLSVMPAKPPGGSRGDETVFHPARRKIFPY